ncbi:MAG: hypothetical protein AB7K24_08170 [Gemmataceae bacterium]
MNTQTCEMKQPATLSRLGRRLRTMLPVEPSFGLFSIWFLGIVGLDIYYTFNYTIPFVLSLLVLVGGFASGLLFLQLASTATNGGRRDDEMLAHFRRQSPASREDDVFAAPRPESRSASRRHRSVRAAVSC